MCTLYTQHTHTHVHKHPLTAYLSYWQSRAPITSSVPTFGQHNYSIFWQFDCCTHWFTSHWCCNRASLLMRRDSAMCFLAHVARILSATSSWISWSKVEINWNWAMMSRSRVASAGFALMGLSSGIGLSIHPPSLLPLSMSWLATTTAIYRLISWPILAR